MPVFNEERVIRRSLDTVLAQTFGDFELIISDNASTDRTEKICREYAGKDARIKYIRQPVNIGFAKNFEFVLEHADGQFFTWWAADDTRSPDFVEVNVSFLLEHPDYVASTCANLLEGQTAGHKNLVTFSMKGEVEERFRSFFDNCWKSHGVFYSLVRTNSLRACTEVGLNYFGVDWSINLFLATLGKVGRVDKGLAVFGSNGLSSKQNVWAGYRCRPMHWFMPFYEFSLYSYKLASGFSWLARVGLVGRLFKLNAVSALFQVWAAAIEMIIILKNRLLPIAKKMDRS